MSVPAFSLESRERNIERLAREPFDVLIVGGGINGAGVARDLMLRARQNNVDLRVALVEKKHFASGVIRKHVLGLRTKADRANPRTAGTRDGRAIELERRSNQRGNSRSFVANCAAVSNSRCRSRVRKFSRKYSSLLM
jgi:glycine/D-amino acid oxidase-like deaminating enzyme